MLSGLELPCIGGNVSFYNEDEQTHRTVNPTPIIVTLGIIEELEWITTLVLKDEGESIGPDDGSQRQVELGDLPFEAEGLRFQIR